MAVRSNGRKMFAKGMSDKKTLDQKLQALTEIAESIANPLGLFVVDVKFGQQGRRRNLEVTIFKKESWVSLSDCEQLSRLLEAELERRLAVDGPIIDGSFDLQVQSPGIDRQLKTEKEFKLFTGQSVQVHAKEKVGDLGVTFKGILVSAADGKLHIAKAEAIKPRHQGKGKQQSPPPAQKQDVTIELKNLINVKLYSDDLHTKRDDSHLAPNTIE